MTCRETSLQRGIMRYEEGVQARKKPVVGGSRRQKPLHGREICAPNLHLELRVQMLDPQEIADVAKRFERLEHKVVEAEEQ
eukprot:CAMPEP_0119369212 /NCGR_PEP_ID=MMETSP1334-20130426/15773_1 /TAXON_ID=127549 /ORGANISM="Calcidiscus leptoporus, Strain RCC1130" /LENGTH=80 /DNA_ID=CAMNT_0007386021 /DNA_START=295 /DNA_END=538 /DNA_ORIENTATION=+